MADNKKKKKSPEISNLEWGMVISLLGIIDTLQIVLDLMAGFGALLNRFVSFGTGLAWTTYLYLRGISLNTPKILGVLLALFLEEVPALDAMPFWFLDGAVMMASVKAEKQLEKVAGVAVAAAAVAAAPETGGASLAVGEAAEGAVAAEEGVAAAAEESGAEEGVEEGLEEPDEDETDQDEKSGDEDDEDEKKEQTPPENKTPEQNDRNQKPRQQNQTRRSSFSNSSSGSDNDSGDNGEDSGNTLNLRGGTAARQRAEKEKRLGALQNITDLSLSYGERKKAKEDEEKSLTE